MFVKRGVERLLIPRSCQLPLINHYHIQPTTGQHCGISQVLKEFVARFYWVCMAETITAALGGCVCSTWKATDRKRAGFKDKGPLVSQVLTRPGQMVFIDAWWADEKNHFMVGIDGFSGMCEIDPLRPMFENSCYGVMMWFIFCWIFVHGFPENVVNDNDAKLVTNMNKIFHWCWGMRKQPIAKYQQWNNSLVELLMKDLNKAVLAESTRREMVVMKSISDKLLSGLRPKTSFREQYILAKGVQLHQNNKILDHGYTAQQLHCYGRVPFYWTSFMVRKIDKSST